MRKLCLFVLAVLAVAGATAAQGQTPGWENLVSLLPGQKIHVLEKNKVEHTGRFVAVSDQGITMHDAGGDLLIAQAAVRQVKASGVRKVKHTLIGAGVGAGSGALFGGLAGRCSNSCFFSASGLMAGTFGLVGALAGGIIGMVLPSDKTVYQAPSR
ncbi:MAG: hypothetical protein ACRD1E_01880 [Terriglobales bacterium]